jgi:hypothetical protein
MPEEANVLDQILRWVIPIGIIIFFAFTFYKGRIKELVDKIFDWIKNQGNKPKGPQEFTTEYYSRGKF